MDPALTLLTDRLTLEPMTLELAHALDGEPRVDWAEDYPAPGERRAAMWVRSGANQVANHPFITFAVRERESGLLIGGGGFHGPPVERTAEIGYGLVPSRRGRGLATEIARALVESAGRSGAVDTLVARTEADNLSSQRVLAACGFTPTTPALTNWRYDFNG